jgi:uncharacterized membrane protein YgaE (UPF0421/DUF939 family)
MFFVAQQDDSPNPSSRRSSNTMVYAIETVAATAFLVAAFHAAKLPGAGWAIITAILVLQPGLNQSLTASRIRIAATLLGAWIGSAAGLLLGATTPALLAGILVTILVCHIWQLDRYLRQACLTVPIIQMSPEGALVHVSYERLIAVLAGCVVAVLVQYAWQFAGRLRLLLRG